VKSQIEQTLEQGSQAQKISKRLQALVAAQKKVTKYAPGYKPAAAPNPTTSGG
jgi:hypothetical protein